MEDKDWVEANGVGAGSMEDKDLTGVNNVLGTEGTDAGAQAKNKNTNFLGMDWWLFVKPMTMIRESLPGYTTFGKAGGLAGVALVVSVLLTMFKQLYLSLSGSLEWIRVLIGQAVGLVIIMLVVAGVFFGVAKMFKSQNVNFWRTLSVVSIAILLMSVVGFVAGIVMRFNYMVSSYISLAGTLYAIIVFYEGMMANVALEGDRKIYYAFLATFLTYVILTISVWVIGSIVGGAMSLVGF